MQSARPRATFRSRRSTCAGRRARSSSVKVRAQLSQLGVGAIERAFLSVFGHMKGHVCQRGRRNRQTQVMVYRMGISMEPVCLHGRIGMFLSEDGYILSRVRRGPTSLCPHGPGEPSGALGRPRGGPPWPSGGWTDPRARGRISRRGKGVNRAPRLRSATICFFLNSSKPSSRLSSHKFLTQCAVTNVRRSMRATSR